MTIGVIGATDKACQRILNELNERWLETLAIVRSPKKLTDDILFIKRGVLAITKVSFVA